MNDELIVYTDGGCSGNPGPGGWAFVLIDGQKETAISGGIKDTTNNRMELTAVIEALSYTAKNYAAPCTIFVDSQYVKDGITKWIVNWKRNGWKTADKKPVKNQDLWLQLDSLVQNNCVKWVWVKGHAGNVYNEKADQLTQEEIKKFKR